MAEKQAKPEQETDETQQEEKPDLTDRTNPHGHDEQPSGVGSDTDTGRVLGSQA